MRRFVTLTLVTACLAACSTPQQRAQQRGQQERAEMDKMIVEFGPACEKLGYIANSDPWRNCVVQLAARDQVGSGVSTSIFGSWGNWGRWGRGSSVGAGVTLGR